MDVRDGFIVGIFNYCDRWCEACAFTSHCRLFADKAEMEASLDPGLKALVEAPPFEPAPPPPPWLAELLAAMDDAIRAPDDRQPRPSELSPHHRAIEQRAHRYRAHLWPWLQTRASCAARDPGDPWAVIVWFHSLIAAKVHRALHGLAEDRPEDRDWPPDYDGSAKVALLGIERSHAAWLELVRCGIVTDWDAAPFIEDLVWIGEAVERVFPGARAFVRPALDEPDEVSRLIESER